jgi:hypothetical protein
VRSWVNLQCHKPGRKEKEKEKDKSQTNNQTSSLEIQKTIKVK